MEWCKENGVQSKAGPNANPGPRDPAAVELAVGPCTSCLAALNFAPLSVRWTSTSHLSDGNLLTYRVHTWQSLKWPLSFYSPALLGSAIFDISFGRTNTCAAQPSSSFMIHYWEWEFG